MKNIVSPSPEPQIGPQYWRSLDELAETPEFQAWAEREFPSGASELADDFSRRDFVKLMSASFLLAGFGMTGCRRPDATIVPFSDMPERYLHGVPEHYATSMPLRGHAIPLVARSNDGRPTKLEGNRSHPDSNGGTDGFAQASLLSLYDPDRLMAYRSGNRTVSRDEAVKTLASVAEAANRSGGDGLFILLERSGSPSRERVLKQIRERYPRASIHVYEPIDFDVHRQSASIVTGKAVRPHYRFDKAEVILSLDCDFLGAEEDQHRHIRDFARGRRIESPADRMNRLYSVEGLMTLTGINADHRLRVPTGAVVQVAAQLAVEVLGATGQGGNSGITGALQSVGQLPDVSEWVTECAKDLVTHKGKCAVVAGHRQPMAVHLIAHALNAALESGGNAVQYLPAPAPEEKGIQSLAEALNSGQVKTLAILGGNPAYNAPAELNWPEIQKKAGRVLRLGYQDDETSALSGDVFPSTHFLESWGDARTSDGTLVPVQPLIEPLFGGMTDLEFLARLAGASDVDPHAIARATFSELAGGTADDAAWNKYLHDGFRAGSAAKPVSVRVDYSAAARVIQAARVALPHDGALEIVFYRDYSVDDGRFSNNGWLQEMPDPITKITWDNVVLLSRATAKALKVANRELVTVELNGRSVTGAVWIQPGLANHTLGLALGYGRERAGRVGGQPGNPIGFNAYRLRTTDQPYTAVGATVKRSGGTHPVACTQDHWSMQGRPIVREANLDQFRKTPDFAHRMGIEAHSSYIDHDPVTGNPLPIYQHPYTAQPETKSEVHQWGMTIDLTSCVGCSACMMACQSENNIPIVGRKQVANSREMHWIRIDRYYSGAPEQREGVSATDSDEDQQHAAWIDDPQTVTQPMLCQHCENAPCESVCPVNATLHDSEGLNVMAYNRCVGTRYCSNNCPYKVRRFNFFDYNKRPIDKLEYGPLASRGEQELELIALAKNPDVTVRMRGVMEKCTFCLQRIEQAKIQQKIKARDTGDVAVPDGTIRTACEQACPAEAIVFGNIIDPDSRVSRLKKQQRNYSVLGYLNNQPRTTYLARIRNPNPSMPDHYDMPLTVQEYSETMGNPYETHGGDAAHSPTHGAHSEPAHGEQKGGE